MKIIEIIRLLQNEANHGIGMSSLQLVLEMIQTFQCANGSVQISLFISPDQGYSGYT